MGETLRMSSKERERLVELQRLAQSETTLAAAARRLGLSYRQAKRIWSRYQAEGDRGLVPSRASRRRSAMTRR